MSAAVPAGSRTARPTATARPLVPSATAPQRAPRAQDAAPVATPASRSARRRRLPPRASTRAAPRRTPTPGSATRPAGAGREKVHPRTEPPSTRPRKEASAVPPTRIAVEPPVATPEGGCSARARIPSPRPAASTRAKARAPSAAGSRCTAISTGRSGSTSRSENVSPSSSTRWTPGIDCITKARNDRPPRSTARTAAGLRGSADREKGCWRSSSAKSGKYCSSATPRSPARPGAPGSDVHRRRARAVRHGDPQARRPARRRQGPRRAEPVAPEGHGPASA